MPNRPNSSVEPRMRQTFPSIHCVRYFQNGDSKEDAFLSIFKEKRQAGRWEQHSRALVLAQRGAGQCLDIPGKLKALLLFVSERAERRENRFPISGKLRETQLNMSDRESENGEEPVESEREKQLHGEKNLSVEEMTDLVQQKYREKGFSGSYAGINILQREIFLQEGVWVPQDIVTSALNKLTVYVDHVRPIRRFERGKYTSIHNYG